MLPRAKPLSARETRIFLLVGEGLSRKQIADQLGMNAGTLQSVMARALRKSGARNSAHLAVLVATGRTR